MHERTATRFQHTVCAGVILGLLFAFGACGKDAKQKKSKRAVQLEPCTKSGRCSGRLVCVKENKGSRGICVRSCRGDSKCSEGWRCTGRYTKAYLAGLKHVRGKGFCQKADIPVGGKCNRLGHFCEKDQACWNGYCRKKCRGQAQCDAKKEKCARIVKTNPKHLSFLKKKTLFNVCVPATGPKGAKCNLRNLRCAPGNECLAGKCRANCKKSADCDKGTRCHRITERVGILKNKVKFLFRACVPATRAEGAACSPKGAWPLCVRDHRCVSGRCARQCTRHEDCSEGKACLGRAFIGRRGYTHMKADYNFCKPGSRNFAPRSTYRKCTRGRDCPTKHVCYAGRCRPFCKTKADCLPYMRFAQKCREVRGKGVKRWKVCR